MLAVVVGLVVAMWDRGGDLAIENESEDGVVVVVDGEDVEVPATGGTVLLDYGCSDGDVVVRYPSGREVTLAGPVCPEQRIVIDGDGATLRPGPA